MYKQIIYNLFDRINTLYIGSKNDESFINDDDLQDFEVFTSFLINNEGKAHLPVPVYSTLKPTMGIRFILHILLSLGHFET